MIIQDVRYSNFMYVEDQGTENGISLVFLLSLVFENKTEYRKIILYTEEIFKKNKKMFIKEGYHSEMTSILQEYINKNAKNKIENQKDFLKLLEGITFRIIEEVNKKQKQPGIDYLNITKEFKKSRKKGLLSDKLCDDETMGGAEVYDLN